MLMVPKTMRIAPVLAVLLLALLALTEAQTVDRDSVWKCEDKPTYYSTLTGKEGDELEMELTSIVKQEYTSLSYQSAWESLNDLDGNGGNLDEVHLIYSDDFAPKQTGCLSGQCVWTREHVWPQSYGVDPEDRNTGASYTDLHNLFPVRAAVNTDRSNDIFAQITTSAGECLSDYPDCEVPAHPTTSITTAEWDERYWQPPLGKRGDIARVLFYMQVRYDGFEPNTANLQLVEDPPRTPSNEEPSTRVFGKLSALLLWHCEDPVDDAERARNDKICESYQHNRNPFVDDPSLVEKVFREYEGPRPPCFTTGGNITATSQGAAVGVPWFTSLALVALSLAADAARWAL
mmetsp:Transcript_3142/g.7583  ORF Transcript_3142/g.7583 Transcript_3142/m.7583 type:complete len:347 (+) Transcript_3142:108-1148(+)